MLKLLFSPSGRLNRQPFIIITLALTTISIVVSLIVQSLVGPAPMMDPTLAQDPNYAQQFMAESMNHMMSMYTHPFMLISIVLLTVIGIIIGIKRLHDLNKSGRWYLINLVPILGGIYFFIISVFQKGTIGDNRFGPDPLKA